MAAVPVHVSWWVGGRASSSFADRILDTIHPLTLCRSSLSEADVLAFANQNCLTSKWPSNSGSGTGFQARAYPLHLVRPPCLRPAAHVASKELDGSAAIKELGQEMWLFLGLVTNQDQYEDDIKRLC